MSEVSPQGTGTFSFGEICDRGKVRQENQDTVRSAAIPLGELFLVADGIGGYEGGATASRMVADGFYERLAALPAAYPAEDALREACAYANASIHAAAQSGDPSLQRMGSTVVLALIQAEAAGFVALIGHVGDSRAYLIRGGKMVKLTMDHSAVQSLLSRNLITEEQALNHPDASVLTRSLGHRPEVEIELDRVQLEAGDGLLLCSDGLWGYVADEDIEAVATDSELSAQTLADALLHQALAAGGLDNIGIEFVRIGGVATPERLATPLAAVPQSASGVVSAGASRIRIQQIVAIGLLLLAGCGYLGYVAHNHSWTLRTSGPSAPSRPDRSNDAPAPNSPGSASATANSTTPANAAASVPAANSGDGSHSDPVPAPAGADKTAHDAMPGDQQALKPAALAKPAQEKKILVVGDLPGAGAELQLPVGTIHWQHIQITRRSRPVCADLGQEEPVVYADPRENMEELLQQHPELGKILSAVQPQPLTPEIRNACGTYDVILILPKRI
jgi:serine/threonine protein phosphatase PrpC